MSQITSTGRRKAKSSTRSMRPLSACSASSPSTTASMRGCRAASARGVKAAARSLRTRVCSGGSLNTRLVGVMLVERRADAELGSELGLLVGAHARVAIADRDVGIARQEHAAVGQALQRREAAQRVIVGEGIVEESRARAPPGRSAGRRPAPRPRQLDQATSWLRAAPPSSANTVRPAALSGPSWASAGGRMTSA